MTFIYHIAGPSDDAELRQLMCSCPVQGAINVAFLREPNFFRAEQIYGRFTETYTMRDQQSNLLAGMGTRAIKPAYINGSVDTIGYLCNLRILPDYQKRSGLARGYAYLRQRHRDNQTRLYLTTIIEDNLYTRSILESGRHLLPTYHDLGRFCMHVINIKKNRKTFTRHAINTRRSTPEDIPQIIKFLNTEGPRKQFFPEYRQEDLNCRQGMLAGLDLDDIYLAFTENILIGIAAAWDQTSLRQNMITGYGHILNFFRPIVNVGLHVLGYPKFPKPQTILDYFNLGLVCIKNNDVDIFTLLLHNIISEQKNTYPLMIAGFHEKDPLLSALQGYKSLSYASRVYIVCWEDGEKERKQLDDRIPYLELGAL